MEKIYNNEKFLNMAKLMAIKLADSCSPRFIKSNFKQIINEHSSQVSEIKELKDKIRIYEEKLKTISENEALKNAIKEQEEKIKNLESLLEKIENKEIILENKEILIENENLRKQNDELKEKNQKYQNEVAKYKQLNKSSNQIIDSLQATVAELNNSVYREIVESQKLRKLLYNERNKIKKLEMDKKELLFSIHRLENRLLMGGNLFGLSIQTRPIEGISKDDSIDSIQVQAEIKRINMELNKKVERIKTLEFEIKELKDQIAHSDKSDLQIENQKLHDELESKNSLILDLKTLRKKLVIQINNLQNRITDLQNQLRIRTDELEENKKVINELEITVKTGVKDAAARELIAKLQNANNELRSEIRAMDSAIRAQDKTNYSLQQQVRSLKNQYNTLYSQSKWQLSQLHRYNDILERAGIDPSSYGLDTEKISADFKKAIHTNEGVGNEITQIDKKTKQLEKYVQELENEINEINFRLMSRDVKINELEEIINTIKAQVADKGIKIKI